MADKSPLSLLEIAGVGHREEMHSNVLAYLLNPQKEHGLGTRFAQAFISACGYDHFDYEVGLRAHVHREKARIDILLRDDERRLIVLIENKIDSKEHSDQLSRYLATVEAQCKGFRILPVYLSLHPHNPSVSRYVTLQYDQIARICRDILQAADSGLPPKTREYLGDYLRTVDGLLERRGATSRKPRVLTTGSESSPFNLSELRMADTSLQMCLNLFQTHFETYRLVNTTTKEVQFVPHSWDSIPAFQFGRWDQSQEMLRFLFKLNEKGEVNLHLYLGEGEQEKRVAIFSKIVRQYGNELTRDGLVRAAGDKWAQIWKFPILTKAQRDKLSEEQLRAIVDRQWTAAQRSVQPLTEKMIRIGLALDAANSGSSRP
jgi:hypothetical protein